MSDELLRSLPAPVSMRAGGRLISVRVLGGGRGPRLMLLHGGPGLDHHLVLPLGLALADRYEVWLPDLPGHGRSHDDAHGLPDLSRVVETLAYWLAGLELKPELLVGHSLGAWLVRELLRLGFVVPRAAVLIAPPSATAGAPAPASGRPGARSDLRTLRAELGEFVGGDCERRPSPLFAAAIARSLLRQPRRYGELHAQLRRVLARPPRPCAPACPTLIVAGGLDPIAPPAACAALAAATPGSQLLTIDGAGHFPFVDDAAPLTRVIERFVSEAQATRTGGN